MPTRTPATDEWRMQPRRAILRAGGIVGGLALGVSGNVVAQDDDNDDNADDNGDDGDDGDDAGAQGRRVALIHREDFVPGAIIVVLSPPINWTPADGDDRYDSDTFATFETRAMRYVGRDGSVKLFYPARNARVRNGRLYRLSRSGRLLDGSRGGLLAVTLVPVRIDGDDSDDDGGDDDDDGGGDDGNGTEDDDGGVDRDDADDDNGDDDGTDNGDDGGGSGGDDDDGGNDDNGDDNDDNGDDRTA